MLGWKPGFLAPPESAPQKGWLPKTVEVGELVF